MKPFVVTVSAAACLFALGCASPAGPSQTTVEAAIISGSPFRFQLPSLSEDPPDPSSPTSRAPSSLYQLADGRDLRNDFRVSVALHTRAADDSRHQQVYECTATGWVNRVPLVDNFDFVGGNGPQFDFPFSAHHFRNLANTDPDGPFGPYRDPSATIGNVAWQITSDVRSFPFTTTVTGALDDQVPNAGSIPLFRLRNSGAALTPSDRRTQRLDDRIFGGVEYILRLNTQGGTTPEAAGCTAESVGSFQPVDYEADYYFLVPR